MTNLATGHIAVYGGGGVTALSGTLTNDGYLSLSAVDSLYVDTLNNYGTVAVDAPGGELNRPAFRRWRTPPRLRKRRRRILRRPTIGLRQRAPGFDTNHCGGLDQLWRRGRRCRH